MTHDPEKSDGSKKHDGLTIRMATEADLALFVVDDDRRGMLLDRLQRQAEHRGELRLAIRAGVPFGHVYLWWEPAEEAVIRAGFPGVPLIMNLWVHDQHRREGIATILLTAAERRLIQLGHTQVALGVDPGNEPAIRMYQNLDYKPWEDGHLIKTRALEFDSVGTVVREGPDYCVLYVKTLGPPLRVEDPSWLDFEDD